MTRCVAVLMNRAPTLSALDPYLRALGSLRVEAGEPGAHWAVGGRRLVLDLDGPLVEVDAVDHPWPGPADLRDPQVADAFTAGAFGSLATPASYQRALDHPWTWKMSRVVAPRHQAFVRLRLAGGDPIPGMMALTRAAVAVMADRGALCLFAPEGEALRPIDAVEEGLRRIGSVPAPLDLWTNTRLASLGPVWQVMDVVGMGQLALPDLEALFDSRALDWRQADAFVRNLAMYLADAGALGDGDRLPGPDGADWEVRAAEASLLEPRRPVLQIAKVGGPDLGVVVQG